MTREKRSLTPYCEVWRKRQQSSYPKNVAKTIAPCYNERMETLGIFYFSSTGNSLYIAKKAKERLGGEKILYAPAYNGDASEFSRAIVVTPIYSFGMPIPILELLSRFNKTTEIIAIQNYGGMIGGADRLFYEYALKNGLNVKSVYLLKMPENFTLFMSPPTFYKNSILKSADERIGKVIEAIKQGNARLPKKKRTKEKTYLKNKANWHLIGERFSVNDRCVKCQKCVSLCPVKNIFFTSDKITFSNECIACLGCFHRCPQKAIIYKNKDNKKRYINPNIDENEIGKNFD